MSTYNGEHYIKEQLDSLTNQKFNKDRYSLEIWCRDDGSSDRTPEILTDYANRNSIIHVLNSSGNVGVRVSFYELLSNVDADYYFFCDQDDVWHSNKIENFMFFFDENVDSNVPGGVYSDLDIVDENNQSLNTTMMKMHNWSYNEKRDFSLFIFKTRVTGASFAINKFARNQLIEIDPDTFKNIGMHDSMAALIVSSYDNLAFIPHTFVNYRQHSDNVLGAKVRKYSIFNLDIRNKRYNQFLYDLVVMRSVVDMDLISKENKNAINAALDFYERSNKVQRVISIIRNYNQLWRNLKVRQLLMLAVAFKK